jgi:hypothetical protein
MMRRMILGGHRLIINEVKPALNRHKFETVTLVFGCKGREIQIPVFIQLAKRIFSFLVGKKSCGLPHRDPAAFTMGKCPYRERERRFRAAVQSSR